jgi:hypothetical protein
VSLPELVTILSWASRLVHAGKDVSWLLPNPAVKQEGLADARERIRPVVSKDVFSDVARKVDELKSIAGQRKLRPGQRHSALDQLLVHILERHPNIRVEAENWLDAEVGPLAYQDLLGFFWRYKVFEQASDAGIRFMPDPRTLATAPLEYAGDTPCLELCPIRSSNDVETLVENLRKPSELQRVLGTYSQMDVVSRGALAHILVNELGRNVDEHADASGAWLCTRLVRPSDYRFQIKGDPAESCLTRFTDGFLEVIVCDNGAGLANRIEPVIKRDPRRAILQKYRSADGKYAAKDLVDYAFDRLASSKRDIVDLVHWDTAGKGDPGPLSSGLYWIWNLVRSHEGVLEVRSSGVCGWYDFTGIASSTQTKETFQIDGKSFPCCGTMVRICLPIRQ